MPTAAPARSGVPRLHFPPASAGLAVLCPIIVIRCILRPAFFPPQPAVVSLGLTGILLPQGTRRGGSEESMLMSVLGQWGLA